MLLAESGNSFVDLIGGVIADIRSTIEAGYGVAIGKQDLREALLLGDAFALGRAFSGSFA